MVHHNETHKSSNVYKDILEIRRSTSDFMWHSRELNLTKAFKQPQDTSNAYKFQTTVLASPIVQELIESVSSNEKLTKKEVTERVNNILREIGHTRQIPVFRCVGICFTKVLKKIVSSLFVNEAHLLKLKSQMGNNPVILVPSHRSYFDFMLMSYVAFHYDIEVPCTAAGMDFESMWLVGKLLRDCNAFFMRRSFGDDQLYRTIFKEYVQHLVINGEAPIEFFIEGTRSRSAKALVPKFGLLTMLVEPFFKGEVPDITFIPVSFSYERVLEESLFSYEMLGVPKPKESTSGLIKALKILDERYGNVHATFGEPYSLRRFLIHNLGVPLDFTKRDFIKESNYITDLGYNIVNCQQNNMVIHSFNLLAIILSNHLMTDSTQPLMIEQVSKDVSWLSAVLSSLGTVVQPIPHSAAVSVVTNAIDLHQSVVRLSGSGAIQMVNIHNMAAQPTSNQKLKGHKLSPEMMNLAVPVFMLQQYVNPCLHFLINPAIITVIMQQIGTTGNIEKYDLFRKFQFIRSLLTHEFVFYKPWEEQDFEDALAKLELLSIVENDPLRLGNHQKLQALLCNLIYPFLSGYLSVCRFLQSVKTDKWVEAQMIPSIQKKVEEELSFGWLLHPYSLSLDMISSCLAALCSLNILSRKRCGVEVQYHVNQASLDPVINELECLVIVPQKYQRKSENSVDDAAKTLHVISSSEPLQRLVSKL